MPKSRVELKFEEDIEIPRVFIPASGLDAERVALAPARYEYATTGATHYLALHDIVMRDGEMRVGGGEIVSELDLRRKITFLPAGVGVEGWTDPMRRPNSFIAIHFDPCAIPEPIRASSVFQQPAVYFQDRPLQETLTKIDRAMKKGAPFLELLAETLCDLAILEFGLRQFKPSESRRRVPRLSERQVAHVKAFIAENLRSTISLSDLSAVVGVSKFHFGRAFKAATGRSPYQQVLVTRVSTARRMLAAGVDRNEVASLTGFTSAAQLGRSIRERPHDVAAAEFD